MERCKTSPTPLNPHQDLSEYDIDNSPAIENFPYQEAVGSISYAAQTTRPDICHAASVLSRYNTTYKKIHIKAVRRVLQYLQGTKTLGICYKSTPDDVITGYCDVDYAGCTKDRRSTAGYVFTFQKRAISWDTKKQGTAALSSCQSEYIALAYACQEVSWLRMLAQQIDKKITKDPTPMFVDNQAAITLATVPKFRARTKQIEVEYHYSRECVETNKITLHYLNTKQMLADFLTKSEI